MEYKLLSKEAYWAAHKQTWDKLSTMREVIFGKEVADYLNDSFNERREKAMAKKCKRGKKGKKK